MADQPKPPRCFLCEKPAIGAHVYSTKLKALADSDFKRFFYCAAHEQQAIQQAEMERQRALARGQEGD
jgi:hypothetical protein